MKHGFIKTAAITPNLKVADTDYNCGVICEYMEASYKEEVKVAVFPELCITGYTCQDLFFQDQLLKKAEEALIQIKKCSNSFDTLFFVGLPFAVDGKLYNMAAAVHKGRILGLIPKTFLPNYNEFYEARHFCSGKHLDTSVVIIGQC